MSVRLIVRRAMGHSSLIVGKDKDVFGVSLFEKWRLVSNSPLLNDCLGNESRFCRGMSSGGDGDVSMDGTNVGRSEKGSTSPRFYKSVSVMSEESAAGTQWFVQLDGRTLKTPSKAKLALPSAGLAYAIAAEWEYQEAQSIRPFTMPLMQLAATAIDRTPLVRSDTIDTLLKYFHTDPALCMAEEDTDLGQFEVEAWKPLIEWFEQNFDIRLEKNNSFVPVNQSEDTMAKLKLYLGSLDDWYLTALSTLASSCKSLILATALLGDAIDLEQAIYLSRAEEEFQIEQWGLVEGGHDLDRADTNVRISSPVVFITLCRLE